MKFIVNLLILLPARIASFFPWAGPLVMRIVVGYVFMLTGWTKLNNLPQMIQNFTEWGIPFPTILTPFASAVIIATMKTWLWNQAVLKTLSIGNAAAYVIAN